MTRNDNNINGYGNGQIEIENGNEITFVNESTPLLNSTAIKDSLKSRSHRDLWLILTSLWIGVFLAALDGTIVATMLSAIGSDFNSTHLVSWLGTSFFVSNSGFQCLYGRFSDIFGRKPALIFAGVVFLLGTIGCTLAQDMNQIILARAIAGIGSGGLTTMSSVTTSDLVSLKDRGLYQGFGNLVFGTASALGGPLGGLFADSKLGWRWGFGLQIPLCIISLIGVIWKVNLPIQVKGNLKSRLARIDFFGAASLVIGVSAFIMGMSLGGNELPWNSPYVWGPIIGSVMVLGIFVFIEANFASDPVMPIRLVTMRTPAATAATNFLGSMCAFGVMYCVPQYFTILLGTSASRAGIHLLPSIIPSALGSLLSGWYMRKTERYYLYTVFSALCTLLGPLLISCWTLFVKIDDKGQIISGGDNDLFIHWIGPIPIGFGFGGLLTTTLVALIASVDPNDIATATGMSYLFRATGSVAGISITMAILQNVVKTTLEYHINSAELIDSIRKSPTTIIPYLDGPTKKIALEAYKSGFHAAFLGSTIFGVLAVVSVLFIREHPLPGTIRRINEESDTDTDTDTDVDTESVEDN